MQAETACASNPDDCVSSDAMMLRRHTQAWFAMPMSPPCPCADTRVFADCCGPIINGTRAAESAEQLMRSRYSAYVIGDADYLSQSWHSDTRPSRIRLHPADRWLGLQIKSARGGPADTEGTVEFVARVKRGGKATRLHETSRFVREDGQWRYLDGKHHS